MLLSRQQRYVLDVLQRLGCVRREQLRALMKAQFFPEDKPVSPALVDAMLRQFRCGNIEVCCEGDTIFLPGRKADGRVLEAVDVMLELSGARPTDFTAEEKDAVLLRFSVTGRRVSLFAVLHAADLAGPDVRAPPVISKAERVIILLSSDCPPPTPHIPNTVFYALRQKDGSHRFFARGENLT